jgi:hypothetical protein
VGFCSASSLGTTGSLLRFVVIAGAEIDEFEKCSISSEVPTIQTIYLREEFISTI